MLTLTRPTITLIGTLLMVLALLCTACEEDDVDDDQNNPDTEQPGDGSDNDDNAADPDDNHNDQVDPAILSSRLLLPNATAIAGTLQPAMDSGYKIDVKDTIFVMKDFHIGDRIQILPDTTGLSARDTVITGVYVQIDGAHEYYDVPGGLNASAWIDESGKPYTTFNFSMDIDLDDLGLGFPFSTEIIIQPHDENGTPMDSFEKTLTVEDPKNESGAGCNDIRTSKPGDFVWEWEFDIYLTADGDFEENFAAPGMTLWYNNQYGGCCDENGKSFSGFPCGSRSPYYRIVEAPEEYYMPLFASLNLLDDGTINGGGAAGENRPIDINYCTGAVQYEAKATSDGGVGTHNFTPGATSLTINADYSGFSKPFPQSEIIYTCHTLVMTVPNGPSGEIGRVYKRLDNGYLDFFVQWND